MACFTHLLLQWNERDIAVTKTGKAFVRGIISEVGYQWNPYSAETAGDVVLSKLILGMAKNSFR